MGKSPGSLTRRRACCCDCLTRSFLTTTLVQTTVPAACDMRSAHPPGHRSYIYTHRCATTPRESWIKVFFFLLLLLHFSAGQTDGADALWDWNRQQQSKRNGRTSISHTQQCISNKMARLCNVKHKHPQHIVIIYFKREEIDEKIFQGVSKETLITLLQRKLRQYFCRQIEEMVCVCVCVCMCGKDLNLNQN